MNQNLIATELIDQGGTEGCRRFSLEYSSTSNSYTYYAKGKSVQFYLIHTETIDVIDAETGEKTGTEDVVTDVYQTDPLRCHFGLANPTF